MSSQTRTLVLNPPLSLSLAHHLSLLLSPNLVYTAFEIFFFVLLLHRSKDLNNRRNESPNNPTPFSTPTSTNLPPQIQQSKPLLNLQTVISINSFPHQKPISLFKCFFPVGFKQYSNSFVIFPLRKSKSGLGDGAEHPKSDRSG